MIWGSRDYPKPFVLFPHLLPNARHRLLQDETDVSVWGRKVVRGSID